jgi:hypothetical protein
MWGTERDYFGAFLFFSLEGSPLLAQKLALHEKVDSLFYG